jgi:hypothetical protein
MRTRTFAALQVVPEARKCRHEGIVLHAFAFLSSQTPSAGHSLLLLPSTDYPLSCTVPPLDSWCLVGRPAQYCCDRGVCPASMLSHCGSNRDAFRDDQRYWVDCDRDRSRIEECEPILMEGCGIEVAVYARHGRDLCGSVWMARQRRQKRSVYVVVVFVGKDVATRPLESPEVNAHRSPYGRKVAWCWCNVCTADNCTCQIWTRQAKRTGINVGECCSTCTCLTLSSQCQARRSPLSPQRPGCPR